MTRPRCGSHTLVELSYCTVYHTYISPPFLFILLLCETVSRYTVHTVRIVRNAYCQQRYQRALGGLGAHFVAFGNGSKDPALSPVGAGAIIIYEEECKKGMSGVAAGREVWSMATGCRTYGGIAHSNNMAEGWALLTVLRAVHLEAKISLTSPTAKSPWIGSPRYPGVHPSGLGLKWRLARWLWREISDYLLYR